MQVIAHLEKATWQYVDYATLLCSASVPRGLTPKPSLGSHCRAMSKKSRGNGPVVCEMVLPRKAALEIISTGVVDEFLQNVRLVKICR